MNRMLRKSILRALIAVLATGVFASGTPAARADDPTISIGTLPIDATAEAYYAQEMGFFKKAGLNVTLSEFTSGGASAAALAGGAVDIGLADLVTMASAHARGVPIVYIAPAGVYKKGAQTYVLVVPESSPIKTAKDFANKTIAVNGIKNINEIPTDAWIDNNGGDSKSAKFIEMPYPSMLPALDTGKVDAVAVVEPFATFARMKHKYRIISLVDRNIAPAFTVAGWATTTAWARAHPDLARKFVAVMAETAKWANSHHAETAQMIVALSKMPPDVANKMERAYYGERLDPALIQPVIDATAKYGAIPKTFPAAEIIDADALR
jgi:NitT/TauT family transport system substrate-binding protein